MSPEEFKSILSLGTELRGVEFKPGGPRTNDWLFAKVARAMIGMANLRDGGSVVIGVEERQKTFVPIGLSDPDRKTWNHDHLAEQIAAYVVPNVRFDLTAREDSGKRFIVISVFEFDDYPVICQKELKVRERKGGPEKVILKRGAIYVRSRAKIATTEVSTEADMRDLIDLAIDKGLDRFARQAGRAGLLPRGTASSSEQYDQELKDLL